jgi:hypothetical protein
MCFVDLEPCEIWNEKHRTARKEHSCSCCDRTIRIGEVYLVHFDVFEGQTTSEKCCAECESDRDIFANEHEGTLCSPGWLQNMIRDCIGEDPESKDVWLPMLERIKNRGAKCSAS